MSIGIILEWTAPLQEIKNKNLRGNVGSLSIRNGFYDYYYYLPRITFLVPIRNFINEDPAKEVLVHSKLPFELRKACKHNRLRYQLYSHAEH